MECPKCKSPDLSWKEDLREEKDLKVERWVCVACGSKITLTLDKLYNKIQLRVQG